MSLQQALIDASEGQVSLLGARGRNAISGFVNMMSGLRDSAAESVNEITGMPDIGNVIAQILDITGYKAELEKSNDPQDGARLDNLNELVSVAREFSSEAANQVAYAKMDGSELDDLAAVGEPEPGSLQAFLERVSL